MQFLDRQFVSLVMDETAAIGAASRVSNVLLRVAALAIMAASVAGCGTADGTASETEVHEEPRQSVWLNPLKVDNSTHRVSAKFQTFVCPNPVDLERAVALHNTGKVDRMTEMGCRYVSDGDQGVQLDRIGRTHEILFETSNGSVELWGFEGHFDY